MRHKMLTILGLTLLIWAVMWCAFAAQAWSGPVHVAADAKTLGKTARAAENIGVSDGPVHGLQDEFYFKVTKENTFDFKGIQFFHLKSPDGTATISVDGDVKLADALKALDGQRVRLTLEPATLVLKKVER